MAEWRLDEAKQIYGTQDTDTLAPHLQHLANYGRHELALLGDASSDTDLDRIRADIGVTYPADRGV